MITKEFDLEDVFVMSQIIDKMGLDADVKKIIEQVQTAQLSNKTDAQKVGKEVLVAIGVDLIGKFIRNLHKAGKEVKQLIANLTGKTVEEVAKMPLREMKVFFTELAGDGEFIDFLKQQGQSTEQP